MTQEKIAEVDSSLCLAEAEKEKLPHLYAHDCKWYTWSRKIFESTEKIILVCGANQTSKSSAGIRKNIHWATDRKLWKTLWPDQYKSKPYPKLLFWYLYPDFTTVDMELETKWKKYLPQEDFKNHPYWGWDYDPGLRMIKCCNGNIIRFLTYGQKSSRQQSGTVHMVTIDEEMNPKRYGELAARLTATDGYFLKIYCPLERFSLWRDAFECIGTPKEKFKGALKIQVSLRDCLEFDDGTPGTQTEEKIKKRETYYQSEDERKARVDGQYGRVENPIFSFFSREKHLRPFPKNSNGKTYRGVPPGYSVITAVDLGSGGEHNHPAAYLFLAVSGDGSKVRVVYCRRLDYEEIGQETTDGDVYEYYRKDRDRILGSNFPIS
ncbi:MAG: hypothetical protein HQK50_09295, partial [Oligoflexia bacterium]|nr:hypothetical protein [Oligoflexia bacterium]